MSENLFIHVMKVLILAVIQAATELLPVSSSAHVIVAEKLMGLDPTAPEMTLLLVMLHTGTMFAVICFFWKDWKEKFFSSKKVFLDSVRFMAVATALTGIVGLTLKFIIEKLLVMRGHSAQIENLFGNFRLMSFALAAVGVLIIVSGIKNHLSARNGKELNLKASCFIGVIQGICLPFRGFSRSGATISTGLFLGIKKEIAEDFSFALAVILTPPVIVHQLKRLLNTHYVSQENIMSFLGPCLLGMVFSFFTGILALIWLSNWLQRGRWYLFGIYCLFASVAVYLLHINGF